MMRRGGRTKSFRTFKQNRKFKDRSDCKMNDGSVSGHAAMPGLRSAFNQEQLDDQLRQYRHQCGWMDGKFEPGDHQQSECSEEQMNETKSK